MIHVLLIFDTWWFVLIWSCFMNIHWSFDWLPCMKLLTNTFIVFSVFHFKTLNKNLYFSCHNINGNIFWYYTEASGIERHMYLKVGMKHFYHLALKPFCG